MNHSIISNTRGVASHPMEHCLIYAGLVLSFGFLTPEAAAQVTPYQSAESMVVVDESGDAYEVVEESTKSEKSFSVSDIVASYSFSSDADVENGGKLGSVEVQHFDAQIGISLPSPESWHFSTELYYSRDELKLTGTVPLPDHLQSLGFNFMAVKNLKEVFGEGWTAALILNPSFSSDSGNFSGESFIFSAVATIGQQVNPDLSWQLGIMAATEGTDLVLPVIAVRWEFVRDWSLLVGYPVTGISYELTEDLSLTGGAIFHAGGTYHVTEAPVRNLNDTYLEYQEIRVGLRVDYKVYQNLYLQADGGMAIERNFDYYDRGYELDGDSAAYGRISIRYSF
ncbi:DUF6268 family outer membrane beta-barrel protein [Cerasicoccus frondis]|uniref:DUF6268 family outer membrane beta-barrel protein n=1 Tax=Cerasicoccus frondis TaxID=490090 RepID=UPI0028529F06|nr:DUF6268 family outer membrane beta-barrel protein [Cerasicoccus frondis]